jgi:hypothetical protein
MKFILEWLVIAFSIFSTEKSKVGFFIQSHSPLFKPTTIKRVGVVSEPRCKSQCIFQHHHTSIMGTNFLSIRKQACATQSDN